MAGAFVTFILVTTVCIFFYEAFRGSSKSDRSLTSK